MFLQAYLGYKSSSQYNAYFACFLGGCERHCGRLERWWEHMEVLESSGQHQESRL